MDKDSVNFRRMGMTADFDDLTAALARFTMKVLVRGRAAPQRNRGVWDVSIEQVGFYVRDSFDFEDEQYLGCWGDHTFLPLPLPALEPVPAHPPACIAVHNRMFREWRKATGRGGDFIVYSDVKWIKLPLPERIQIH